MQLAGSVAPGIWSIAHSGGTSQAVSFSTYDASHDSIGGGCGTSYSNTPWWYVGCWSGSISGGGEWSGGGYYNAAFWTGATNSPGNGSSGSGYGNGWMYVK